MPMDSPATHASILRQAICDAFPDEPFIGMVTNYDDAIREGKGVEDGIPDDDIELYKALSGRRWSEAPRELLSTCMVIDHLLLTTEANVAYIAAWLLIALEFDDKNMVREFLVGSYLPPSPEEHRLIGDHSKQRVRAFSKEQLSTLIALMEEFARNSSLEYVRKDAKQSAQWIGLILQEKIEAELSRN